MALLKIQDFEPNYRETLGGNAIDDIKGRDVYTQETEEKIGTIDDILVEEHTGEFRYLLLNLVFGTMGKKVLLPVGCSRISHSSERVYANLSSEQAKRLPEIEPERTIDYDYEEQVRSVYRTDATASSVTPVAPLETSAPIAASAPLDATTTPSMTGATATGSSSNPTYNRDTYTYQQEPSLYEMNAQDHQTLKLYEERLTASKKRMKTGEITVGKHVETETKRVSVPIEKERVVIERVTPPDVGNPVSPDAVDFLEGEVAHVEIYSDTPDIHKEAFVREEVRVNKIVEHETVQVQEKIRREEINIDSQGQTIEDRTGKRPKDRI